MLGYIFFTITTLFYVGLAMLTASKPSMSGDNGMGYGLVLAFLGLGFAVSSLALTLTISARSGFQWLTTDASLRTAAALACWLFVVITIFFCAVFKWEWHSTDDNTYPQFLHGIAVWHGQLWIPLLWLVACFFALNPNWQASFPPNLFKISFFAAFAVSALYSGGLALGYLRQTARDSERELAARNEQEQRWHQETLNFIATQKPEDPIINVLAHTNRFQDNDIRQAAIAKVKAHPDWESEVLALLKEQCSYREVYYFLDGNSVSRPKEFAEALNESIGWMASTIAADIRDSNNLQNWSFDMYGIDRMLRAIDEQFQGQGVNFYPNVLKLQQALNTTPPERFKGVRFTITDVVDGWLKVHKQ
ncbi:hypothetical protein GCM10027341_45410 [Spirosoma knui]